MVLYYNLYSIVGNKHSIERYLLPCRYLLAYQEPMPVEQLVSHICDIQHGYTMYGGRRPFGVSMLFMGWDKHFGYQLYQSDPSGNFLGWKATCIGSSSSAASSILESDYKPEFTSEEAVKLCIKVLYKTMTMSKLTSDKVRLPIIHLFGLDINITPRQFILPRVCFRNIIFNLDKWKWTLRVPIEKTV